MPTRLVAALRKKADLNSLVGWTGDLGYIPHVALGGLAAGGAARLGKNLLDLYRRPPDEAVSRIEPGRVGVSDIPIEVSREEAEELERQGVRVRRKKAAVEPSPINAIGYGALGAGTLMGGWSLADWIIDNARKGQIRGDIAKTRNRIKKLLGDDPDHDDAALYSSMKAAEDVYFSKTGKAQEKFVKEALLGPLNKYLALAGLGVGAGGLLAFLGELKKTKSQNQYARKVLELRKAMLKRRSETPMAVMAPVLQEEEEIAPVVAPPPVQDPKPKPVAPAPKQDPAPASAYSWI